MKFGKLFRALINEHSEFKNLSSNKCSNLSYKELREISKAIYYDVKRVNINANPLCQYMRMDKSTLAKQLYLALNILYN